MIAALTDELIRGDGFGIAGSVGYQKPTQRPGAFRTAFPPLPFRPIPMALQDQHQFGILKIVELRRREADFPTRDAKRIIPRPQFFFRLPPRTYCAPAGAFASPGFLP